MTSSPSSVSLEEKSAHGPGLESQPAIDPIAEQRLLRKLDWSLLPLFTLIYSLNFIDRTAIGNAKIAGLEKDLGMHGFDFNIALTAFYVFFVVSEIPSNLVLKRFGSISLAFMVVAFGVCTIGTAFIRSYSGLIATRVFLGIAEGGTLPGLSYLLSRYYRRSEFVLRMGIFLGISPCIAGAFGGLLASGLLSLNDIGSVTRWRKIFLVEGKHHSFFMIDELCIKLLALGIITTAFGLICIFIIPTDPQYTKMLTPDERALALARIDADQPARTKGHKEKTTLRLILRAFNFNTCLCALAYLMINISFQGLSLFMPTVISGLGRFTVVQSQLRTVPPYMIGAVWALALCYMGFRLRKRAAIILLTVPLVVAGYGIAIGTRDVHARYAACFLMIVGAVPTAPLLVAWGTDNAAPDTVRAVTTAIIPGVGALGSVIAVWTYLPSDAPNYHIGNSLNLGLTSSICVLIVIGLMYIRWENGKRERGERDYRLLNKTEEIEQLGYLHPHFRYQT
ncbi:hypothetical protein HGRIS_005169 [Hohenbuehelia grisea]|uniref:Major facilitator superfamily (MFS) profile domain-containing protein n=1 Tax=Hohenbuehelia grisea TaxID=104357 RepID=A0ABR3JF18_9AGAR